MGFCGSKNGKWHGTPKLTLRSLVPLCEGSISIKANVQEYSNLIGFSLKPRKTVGVPWGQKQKLSQQNIKANITGEQNRPRCSKLSLPN